MIRARIEPEVKVAAESVLARLGLRPTDAISMLYHQIILRQGLPFDVRLPSNASDVQPDTGTMPAAPDAALDPNAREWDISAVFARLREADQWRNFVLRLRNMEIDDVR